MAEQMARQTHLGIDGSKGHKNREVADAGFSDFHQLWSFHSSHCGRSTNGPPNKLISRSDSSKGHKSHTVADAEFSDFHTASRFNFWHLIPVAFLSDKNRISEDLLIIYIQMWKKCSHYFQNGNVIRINLLRENDMDGLHGKFLGYFCHSNFSDVF